MTAAFVVSTRGGLYLVLRQLNPYVVSAADINADCLLPRQLSGSVYRCPSALQQAYAMMSGTA